MSDRLKAAREWLQKRWELAHPNEGHVKMLAEYAAHLSTLKPEQILRCEKTGNPVGTDTWGVGYACDCTNCLNFAAGLSSEGEQISAEPVGYAIKSFFTERRKEFEDNGMVIYHQPMGMATMPLFSAPKQISGDAALERAIKALEPFATACKCNTSGLDKDDDILHVPLTVGDLRRARAALTSSEQISGEAVERVTEEMVDRGAAAIRYISAWDSMTSQQSQEFTRRKMVRAALEAALEPKP